MHRFPFERFLATDLWIFKSQISKNEISLKFLVLIFGLQSLKAFPVDSSRWQTVACVALFAGSVISTCQMTTCH